MNWPLRQTAEGVLLDLHVQPGARRSRIVGSHGERLKVAVSAPPDQGKANAELLALLTTSLQLRRGTVQLVSGASNRAKVVLISEVTLAEISARLQKLLDSAMD